MTTIGPSLVGEDVALGGGSILGTDLLSRTLAICGGEPAFPDGPPAWRPDEDAVAARLREAMERGTWNRYHGPNLAELVERLATLTSMDHVLPTSSGTFAVELALRGVGVEAGDEVILGGYDFPGNFRAIEAIGAVPVLVDLDAASRCLAVDQAIAACGPHTKAIVATHLHGGVVDMPRLMQAASMRGIAVVEDACQAIGGFVAGKPAGAWGDGGVFSFGGSKLLTAGRGGAVVTRRADVLQRMKVFAERGNLAFPLSELQATVLLPQLVRLAERQSVRRAAVKRLNAALDGCSGLIPPRVDVAESQPAYYKLGLLYDAGQMGGHVRSTFIAAAQAEGIAIDAGFRGFVLRGGRRCRRVGGLPVAQRASEDTLVLHHPILLEPHTAIDRLAEVLRHLSEYFRSGMPIAAAPTVDQDDESA